MHAKCKKRILAQQDLRSIFFRFGIYWNKQGCYADGALPAPAESLLIRPALPAREDPERTAIP